MGDTEKYKLHRNHILTLTRLSKKLYFHEYFETNLSSIKKTWEGINSLLNGRRNRKSVSKIKKPDNSGFTQDPSRIANILKSHFASIGHKLASKLPQSSHHLADYYHRTSFLNSFFSHPCDPVWGSTRNSVYSEQQIKYMVCIRVHLYSKIRQ